MHFKQLFLMSLNIQQLSAQNHHNYYPTKQTAYQLYKRQRQFTTEGRDTHNQKLQFTCAHNLSYDSDDEITFKQKQSTTAISMSHFQEEFNQYQSFAKVIIDQNRRLKQQLKGSKQQVQLLKKELKTLESKVCDLESSCQTEFYKKIIMDLKSEILVTLTQNKQITEEINRLKYNLSYSAQNSLKELQKQRIGSKSLTNVLRCRSNSLEISKQRSQMNESKQQQQYRKIKELLGSIKCMYEKITGFRNESLKQLWRWLKDLGHFYSYFRKWKLRAQCCLQHLCYSTIANEELTMLIQQAIKLVQ